MTAKDLIGQQARWVDLMSEFDFTIQHRAGVSHTNADALSRKITCELQGVDCRQCHRYVRDTFEVPKGPGCNRIRVVTPDVAPVLHRHRDTIRAQPVQTRAQARRDIAEGVDVAPPVPNPQANITPDTLDTAFDQWIGTIRVRIATGDIVHQHARAIVNPANSHLNHFGGVARAIADAAGNDLIGECETYRQQHGLLPTTGVTHMTAGRLWPGIEYVVNTVGPRDVDYPDKKELQIALTATFYNTLKYVSETLRISDLCLPAISSGIFKVPLASVVRAFYTALTLYTDEYCRTSHTPILQRVCLIDICSDKTATTAQLFRDMYNSDRPTPAPDITPPHQAVRPSGRQANCRARAHKRVEERMEVWTPAKLRQRQEEDHDPP